MGSGCPNGQNPTRWNSAISWDKNNALKILKARCYSTNPAAVTVVEMRVLAAAVTTSGKELSPLSVAGRTIVRAATAASAAVAAT